MLEAFHYPFHPLFQRACELIAAGAIGDVRHVETVLRMPAPPDDDPRWSLELAGARRWTSAATPCTVRASSGRGSWVASRPS